MRPRLLRAVANTVAVFGVLAGLLGSALALILSVYTRYDAKGWHFIVIGAVALFLIILAAVLHFATKVYERRRVIRDAWDVVKNADTLDPDNDPAVDPSVIAQRTVDALAAEVLAEMSDELPAYRRKQFKKRVKITLGAVAVTVPVALTGALLAMQKKLSIKDAETREIKEENTALKEANE